MEKSFYYSVPWSGLGYLKETLQNLEIPFVIEHPSDKLPLEEGEVAIVFPDMHVRVYNHVRELFGGHGKRYE
ncbi:hypothetical protein P9G84_22230 [Brevibacillus centrosporus]|uniref:hypothetical protein n=1 Tax=Brevibacillus centrosporus TaxID=54910 RepID=UPI000F0A6628|nr:hypothetical protein [Brevibacillus centrosporus]MEC2131646.1 hypothetical protein [Brevibacillus centrosporus]RNB63274.1 hypothetical protein EDM55_29255 [Brevibacillus centrosporus]GED34980.1 hypothetical protein BCE02nite_61210 [Brevibacillus centrosporus]